MKLIECVPNFSEGKDRATIQSIVDEIASVNGTTILDVDMGEGANRTVMTFVAHPESVVEAGFRSISSASRLIDMRIHKGNHPRMGATDVFPLIPVCESTLEECDFFSRQLGERVGTELMIPVYLYEAATKIPHRKKLSAIRYGGYESFTEKMKDPYWRPDFGPGSPHIKAGVTAIGTRALLIAFNINLGTDDIKLAKQIAAELRESGKVLQCNGKKRRLPGLLKDCQAIGWYMPEYGFVQVSTNLTDYQVTPPHMAYETCKLLAVKYGTTVIGSELIGMIPKQAILMAGRYYAEQNSSHVCTEDDLITLAIEAMGLNSIHPFESKKKILEYRIQELMNISINL